MTVEFHRAEQLARLRIELGEIDQLKAEKEMRRLQLALRIDEKYKVSPKFLNARALWITSKKMVTATQTKLQELEGLRSSADAARDTLEFCDILKRFAEEHKGVTTKLNQGTEVVEEVVGLNSAIDALVGSLSHPLTHSTTAADTALMEELDEFLQGPRRSEHQDLAGGVGDFTRRVPRTTFPVPS